MGVSIMDYLLLAKAGYKKADIDKILSQPEKEEETNPKEQPAATAPTLEEITESAELEKASEKEEKPEPKKDEIDYKELYEKSQEDLKKAQAQNRGADASQNATDPETDLKSVISSFF